MPLFPLVVLTSSIFLEGSVSKGMRYERRKYSQTLLGRSGSEPNGGLPYCSLVDANLTGTLGIPSWTKAYLGPNRNSAFVNVALSSSDHESQVLNLFNSGTEPMESSAVPVTHSLYYSKQSQLNRIIVKLTSSQATGLIDDANFGTLVSPTASINQPLKFNFSVPVTGKLTDIKIWVEIVMLSSSNAVSSTGSAGALLWAAITGNYQPLESLGISLRSPNVSWPRHWAHPIMNDPGYNAHATLTGTGANILEHTRDPQEFYRDSFLIWESPALFDTDYWTFPIFSTGNVTVGLTRQTLPVWERDWGMRTVFYDGSPISNPRFFSIITNSVEMQANGAPCVSGTWPTLNTVNPGTYQHGNNVPWYTDSGSWGNNSAVLNGYNVAGSPPSGWLTGPGGTANPGEWPTTGSNLGATSVRPMYPFLDPLYQGLYPPSSPPSKWSAGLPAPPGIGFPYPDYQQWQGFRPGLRDTEISGTWTLMFARPPSGSVDLGESVNPWMFVRQARIEIVYSQNRGGTGVSRIFSRGKSPRRGGPRFLGVISGSDRYHNSDTGASAQGCFVHSTWTTEQTTPGTIFGIFIGTGSAPADVALEWRLSGGVLAAASGSGPAWLTNNSYGMPAIPFVSWSLGFPIVPVPISSSVNPLSVIFPSKNLDGAKHLATSADEANPRKTLVQIAQGLSTGSH